MHTPLPRSLRKILVPPPLGVSVKNGYPLPGCRNNSRAAGANGAKGAFGAGRGFARKGYFAMFWFFCCVCIKWIPPPRHLCKIFIAPTETLLETGTPPLSKSTTPTPYEKFWTIPYWTLTFSVAFSTRSAKPEVCNFAYNICTNLLRVCDYNGRPTATTFEKLQSGQFNCCIK